MICQTVVPVGLELPTKLAPVYNAAWSEANQSLILLKMIMYQTYTRSIEPVQSFFNLNLTTKIICNKETYSRLITSVLCPLHLFAPMSLTSPWHPFAPMTPSHLLASMTPLHPSVHITSWYHDTFTLFSSYNPITPCHHTSLGFSWHFYFQDFSTRDHRIII